MKKEHWSYIFWVSSILGMFSMFLVASVHERGLLNGKDFIYAKLLLLVFLIVALISNLATAETEEQRYGRLVGLLATAIIVISKYLW